jgi:hypothetical protein
MRQGAGSQNSALPHLRQNPRLAPGEERYQRSMRPLTISRSAGAQAEYAPTCVCILWQNWQWQISTSRNAPRTSKRTDPHRQPPVARTGLLAPFNISDMSEFRIDNEPQ